MTPRGGIPHDASSIYRARLFRGVVPKTLPQGAERMSSESSHGLVHLRSPYAVSETIARLAGIVSSDGLTALARIDHSGNAAQVGMEMNPTGRLTFGSSKAGTPLLVSSPTAAIVLP